MFRRITISLLLLLNSACFQVIDPADSTPFACETDSDCPEASTCDLVSKLCRCNGKPGAAAPACITCLPQFTGSNCDIASPPTNKADSGLSGTAVAFDTGMIPDIVFMDTGDSLDSQNSDTEIGLDQIGEDSGLASDAYIRDAGGDDAHQLGFACERLLECCSRISIEFIRIECQDDAYASDEAECELRINELNMTIPNFCPENMDAGSWQDASSVDSGTGLARPPRPGEIVITEVFRNPAGNQPEKVREWFEVFNPTSDTLVLDGLVIEDNGGANRAFTVGSAQIGPGEYGIFAYSADPGVNGGLTTLVAYGMADLQLSTSGDLLKLILGGTVIDEVEWGIGWPGAGNGTAMCLKFPYGDNSQSASWGNSLGTFGTNSETGHPGVASDSMNCP